MAKRLSDWEKEQRIKDKARAARTRYGVFVWEAANMYRPASALKVFKTEAAACAWLDDNARPDDNWVTRSFELRENGDVVDASGRFAEREAERKRAARERVEGTLEEAADLMAADPGFQQAARKRQAVRKMAELAAGAQLFQPRARVVYAPTAEDIENDDIAIPPTWVGTIVEHTWYDESEREDPEMAHYYTVRWRTPQGQTHEGFYDQEHLAPYVRKNPAAKPAVEAAVKAAQLYAGSMSCNIRDAQKLYRAAQRACERVAKQTGMDVNDVFEQVSREAARRGPITPMPGKDI